jgi:signal peptidase I
MMNTNTPAGDTPVTYRRPRLRRIGALRELLNSVFFIAAALIISELAFPRSSISGPSMEPTLCTGQHLLISRLDYLFGEPRHGDIAVFETTATEKAMLIKRVLGVPGDLIEIRERELYRNGEKLDEPYFYYAPCTRDCPDRTWQLGEGEYFLAGDNRNQSNDSRRLGPIPRANIVGKALFRYYPLDRIGSLYVPNTGDVRECFPDESEN